MFSYVISTGNASRYYPKNHLEHNSLTSTLPGSKARIQVTSLKDEINADVSIRGVAERLRPYFFPP